MSLAHSDWAPRFPGGRHLLQDGRHDGFERAGSRVNPAVRRQLNGFLRAVLLLLKMASARKPAILSNPSRHDARLAEHQRSRCDASGLITIIFSTAENSADQSRTAWCKSYEVPARPAFRPAIFQAVHFLMHNTRLLTPGCRESGGRIPWMRF